MKPRSVVSAHDLQCAVPLMTRREVGNMPVLDLQDMAVHADTSVPDFASSATSIILCLTL